MQIKQRIPFTLRDDYIHTQLKDNVEGREKKKLEMIHLKMLWRDGVGGMAVVSAN